MPRRILRSWTLFTIAGVAVYVALVAMGLADSPFIGYWPSSAIWAIPLIALALAILLALDELEGQSGEQIEKMTFAALAYVLLVKRKSLLMVLVLGIVGTGLLVYYISKSIGVTVESEGGTLSLKLPGQMVYYFPIHSQETWQNTGINLKAGREFKYSVTGYVSPGYLQDIDDRSRNLRAFRMGGAPYKSPDPEWPFTGPEGYKETWYADMAKKDRQKCVDLPKQNLALRKSCENAITKSFKEDNGLTVQGVTHNRVIGIIMTGNEKPRKAKDGKPGYDHDNPDDQKKLIVLEGNDSTALKKTKANADGVLWVVINDADAYRWDNSGMFFLKLVIP